MDIVKYISDLLYDHECVIIPGLGGFVSSYRSASVHPVQHQFNPPGKTLMFNEALQNNDGLLANHISSKQRISFESALEIINQFVVDVKSTLANGGQFSFNDIGNLYLGRDGNLQFDQNNRINYLKDVYGMSSFVSPAIRRGEPVTQQKVIKPQFNGEVSNSRSNQNTGFLIRIAAAVLVVVTLGVFGYSYFRNAAPEVQQTNLVTSLNDIVKSRPEASQELSTQKDQGEVEMEHHSTEESSNENEIIELKNTDVAPDSEIIPENKPEPYNAATPSTAPVVKPAAAKKMYHLIAGSFQDDANTGTIIQKYVALGYNPTVIGPSDNGYFRVSIIAFLRKDEALVELQKVREKYNPEIWLLRQ
jgi:cell division protein FtsN/nucleoid DNA-binding protein